MLVTLLRSILEKEGAVGIVASVFGRANAKEFDDQTLRPKSVLFLTRSCKAVILPAFRSAIFGEEEKKNVHHSFVRGKRFSQVTNVCSVFALPLALAAGIPSALARLLYCAKYFKSSISGYSCSSKI